MFQAIAFSETKFWQILYFASNFLYVRSKRRLLFPYVLRVISNVWTSHKCTNIYNPLITRHARHFDTLRNTNTHTHTHGTDSIPAFLGWSFNLLVDKTSSIRVTVSQQWLTGTERISIGVRNTRTRLWMKMHVVMTTRWEEPRVLQEVPLLWMNQPWIRVHVRVYTYVRASVFERQRSPLARVEERLPRERERFFHQEGNWTVVQRP